jgi:M6 family metalloprotease-like protein/uncharacterized repeat protein (TIGR02543 family)
MMNNKITRLLLVLGLLFILIACGQDSSFSIHFHSNGGTLVEDIAYDEGMVIIMPENPSRDGYTFDGWYWDQETLSDPFSASSLSDRDDLTDADLYAKWELVEYEITYVLFGGLNHGGNPSSYTILENHTLLSPSRTNYVFAGWYRDAEYATPITEIEVGSFGDISLYAKWTLDGNSTDTYTIIWQNEDGSVLETDITLVGILPTYNGVTPVKTSTETQSFTFMGWTPSVVIVSGNQTYVATYEAHDINLEHTFDPSEVNSIFGYDIIAELPTITTTDYIVLNFSDASYLEVYIDIFDWLESDAIAYSDLLDLMLVYDDFEESWVVGEYYIYIYIDDLTYEGLEVYGIGIYGDLALLSWAGMISVLESDFNEPTLETILPELEGLTGISLNQVSGSEYGILGSYQQPNNAQMIEYYIEDLELLGYLYNAELSLLKNKDVYALTISTDLVYALYITFDEVSAEIRFWSFDPTVVESSLETLPTRQTINQYEVQSFGQSGLPSVGTYDVLVIPVEIKDYPFPSNYLTNLDLTFNGTSFETGWESVSSYYYKSSFGKLDLNFEISTKYTTVYNKSFYQNHGDLGDQYAIVEALNALNSQIDYSQYDYNQDGLIDSVIFIYSVDYDFDADPWWAWVYAAQFGEASNITTLDGKSFEYYMWASYAFLEDGLVSVSNLVVNAETYIHELGHLMGFVDLYSYTHDYGPVGGFDMMDFNGGDHGPLNKLLFGWLQPLLAVKGSYEVTLESYSIDSDGINSAVLIPYRTRDMSDGNAFDEYLLVMFYTPEGLYSGHLANDYIPNQAGIVVYHIDARVLETTTFWDNYFMYNNDGTSDFIVEILEADKNDSIPSLNNPLQMSDLLTIGTLNLSSYTWHQGGAINVSIEVLSVIYSTSDTVSFVLTVS